MNLEPTLKYDLPTKMYQYDYNNAVPLSNAAKIKYLLWHTIFKTLNFVFSQPACLLAVVKALASEISCNKSA